LAEASRNPKNILWKVVAGLPLLVTRRFSSEQLSHFQLRQLWLVNAVTVFLTHETKARAEVDGGAPRRVGIECGSHAP
jgi:hypothetical protein